MTIFCNQYGENLTILYTEKNQNLWMNKKVRGDKNASSLHCLPYQLNVCRKYEFLISQNSVATCLR